MRITTAPVVVSAQAIAAPAAAVAASSITGRCGNGQEAVLSSQIEGTQSSLSDLLLFANEGAPGLPRDDVEEAANYIAAMNHGLARLRSNELLLSNRLLREVHLRLMSGVRGGDKDPVRFRRSQNWIGGTRAGNARFVPPPPTVVPDAMSNLEKFPHDEWSARRCW